EPAPDRLAYAVPGLQPGGGRDAAGADGGRAGLWPARSRGARGARAGGRGDPAGVERGDGGRAADPDDRVAALLSAAGADRVSVGGGGIGKAHRAVRPRGPAEAGGGILMTTRRALSPEFTRALQLAATLLAVIYMVLIGGTFDATLRFRVQLLNYVAAAALALLWLGLRWARGQPWRQSGVELPLLLFVATQWVADATSAQPRLSLESAAGVVAWSAAFCIVYDLLAGGWPRAYLINALIVVAAVLSVYGVWAAASWYVGWIRLGQWPPVTFRDVGL